MLVTLNQTERDELFIQPSGTAGDGGFQSLLVGLQSKLNGGSMEILLSAQEMERIPRYAFDYENGGWETRLVKIFSRTLGPKLGRP
jgi:hypothetical protein